MTGLIEEITRTLTRGFRPLTIVTNPDGFLAQPQVLARLRSAVGIEIVTGSQLELRVDFELNRRRNPDIPVIYVVKSGRILPDISSLANTITVRISDYFPNYEDQQTLSQLSLKQLMQLYDRHIQGRVSAARLQMMLENEASKVADPMEEYGRAVELINATENPDWSAIATIDRISTLFAEAVKSDCYKEIAESITRLNYDFQHYLDETYWNQINANPLLSPGCVNNVIPHIQENYGASQRVALVVVDGMAFWQYTLLRTELGKRKVRPKSEKWVYSWLPSITALSRQAIFRGSAPLIDYAQSPTTERALWISHWNAADYAPQYVYDGEPLAPSGNCRRLALVTVALDEKMHSSSNYRDLLSLTQNWTAEFADKMVLLKKAEFEIVLTTDHGNVLAQGWRPFSATEKAHLYGKSSRGRRHAMFMSTEAANEFQSALGYAVNTLRRDNWLVLRDDNSFTTTGRQEITHGGTHFFEVMIPFIKF